MSDNQQPPPLKPAGLSAFWAELKRRKVMRVAITYAVVAWLIIQIAATVFPQIGLPEWAPAMVTWVIIIGFPFAVIIAWAFELTPDGIKTTKVAQAERGDAPVSEKQQRKRNWFTFLFGAAVPTLIFGALALYFYATRSAPLESELAPSEQIGVEENEKSIAVLPLENMSPDPDNAFFADGVQEDILMNLSKIKDLLVISRTSTLRYKETTKNTKEIGQELNVRYLVEGSVRRAGNQVRLTVQLIDSYTDGNVWSENYNRPLDDIFAIQAEVAKEIAGQLQAVLSPQDIENIEYRPTQNQEAYDYFVQYRQLLELPNTRNWPQKIDLLERAVALDPNFAEAWARLAQERSVYWSASGRNDSELISAANVALDKASSLKPRSAELLFVKGLSAYRELGDSEAAIGFLLEALAMDPSYYYAERMLGLQYLRLGRLTEAQHYWEAVHKTDPLSPRSNRELLLINKLRKKWDQARALIGKNLKTAGDPVYWNRKLTELQFLQYGNKQVFIIQRKAALASQKDPLEEAKIALLARDFDHDYDSLSNVEGADRLELIDDNSWGNSLDFGTLNLLKAVIHFHRKELDLGPKEFNAVRDNPETEVVSNEDPNSPNGWAARAIYHALENDREGMEKAILEARELNSLPRWKYNFAVESELRISVAYIVLGDHDKAIKTLEAASKMDSSLFLNRELDLWFIFDRLRGNPRFDALLED